MTSIQIAERLRQRGLDPTEVQAKEALYGSVLADFRGRTSRAPERAWWVPGRLEVFGTHTDYAGGRTLIAAVPRGFAVVAARRVDDRVRISDARNGEEVTIGQSEGAAIFHGWRRYAAVVVERLRRNFPGARLSADITFASDLPRASGMSSSSALMVGVATALVRLGEVDLRADWRSAISNPLDEAAYYACVESGLSFGALGGDAGVGTHGGSEDHVAMVCGEPAHLSEYAFVPARLLDRVQLPGAWSFVVMSSGVPAEKGGSAQAAFNALAGSAAALLDLSRRTERSAPSLGGALAADAAAAGRLRASVRRSRVKEWPSELLERRLDHFVAEDARVPEAVRAFRAADQQVLGELSRTSQADAEALLKNQIPETSALARSALSCGAFASRSFGAGFGGSVWALVERDNASAFVERWLADYRRTAPAAAMRAAAFIATPGPPVTDVSS